MFKAQNPSSSHAISTIHTNNPRFRASLPIGERGGFARFGNDYYLRRLYSTEFTFQIA